MPQDEQIPSNEVDKHFRTIYVEDQFLEIHAWLSNEVNQLSKNISFWASGMMSDKTFCNRLDHHAFSLREQLRSLLDSSTYFQLKSEMKRREEPKYEIPF